MINIHFRGIWSILWSDEYNESQQNDDNEKGWITL